MQMILTMSPYLILPAAVGLLMAAGRNETAQTRGPGGALEKAAAFLYRLFRKKRAFPGEREVYKAECLLDAPMGAGERTRKWYISKLRTLLLFFLAADLTAAALHLGSVFAGQLMEGGIIERNPYGEKDKELDLEAGELDRAKEELCSAEQRCESADAGLLRRIYVALQQVYDRLEDYRMAYHYASLQLKG